MALTDSEYLRLLLEEKVPATGTEEDTLFTDAEIEELLARKGSHMNSAAAEGWAIKAGVYAELTNIDESGSKRSLSDLHKHALAQATFYLGLVKAEKDDVKTDGGAITTAIKGKVASLRERPSVSGYDTVYSTRLQREWPQW